MLKPKLDAIAERLKQNLTAIRTGRATPALVDGLEVDYYGAKTPLKSVAAISAPDARQLIIQPWDKSILPAIEKAIQTSSLGLAPIADKDRIRITLPTLTEERRRELLKFLGREVEDARIRVRQAREDALREVDRAEKAKQISEDEKFRQKNEIQKQVDGVNRNIQELESLKEKEIMTV